MLQWEKGKNELEIVDMIIRIRDKLVCMIAHLSASPLRTLYARPNYNVYEYRDRINTVSTHAVYLENSEALVSAARAR